MVIFAQDALEAIDRSPISGGDYQHRADQTRALGEGECLSVGPLMAESILRIHKDISMSSLFL